jgi:hypothetical protein
MSVIPTPPAPYTDFANQYQRGTPGVLPTGRIQIPQSNATPPNAQFGIPKQMQSGLNANDYTFQVRLLDVDYNRNGVSMPNTTALSTQPFTGLTPYSLLCVCPPDNFMNMNQQINEADRPLIGCVLGYLLESGVKQTYTAFERALDPTNTNPIWSSADIDISSITNTALGNIVKSGLLLPKATLAELKAMMINRAEKATLQDMRTNISNVLKNSRLFDKWRVDGASIFSTLGTSPGDDRSKEIDEASGFATFSTKIEGHGFVSDFTTALKCHVMDTIYVVIRAIALTDALAQNLENARTAIVTEESTLKTLNQQKALLTSELPALEKAYADAKAKSDVSGDSTDVQATVDAKKAVDDKKKEITDQESAITTQTGKLQTAKNTLRTKNADLSSSTDTTIRFKSPEVCILTSRQIKQAYNKAGNDIENMGDQLRMMLSKSDRTFDNAYVILGGWKVGKVVDLHGIPAADHQPTSMVKGSNFYEMMLNIERCTAYDLIRHVM